MRWRDELWSTIGETTFPEILAHPFLKGLTEGDLPETAFRYYVEQDALYLRDFGRGLAHLASKARSDDAFMTLCVHARNALVVERALHEGFLSGWGARGGAVAAGPATTAYTGFLRRAAADRPFAEAFCSFLPCYWIYLEVGKALTVKGSPHPLYRRWIETYGGDAFAAVVEEALAIAEADAPAPGSSARERAKEGFALAAKHEWSFWDAAWQRR